MLGLKSPVSEALRVALARPPSPTAPLTLQLGVASLGPAWMLGSGVSQSLFSPPLGLFQTLDVGQSSLGPCLMN